MKTNYYLIKNDRGNVMRNCRVYREGLTHVLVSYSTRIADYNPTTKKLNVYGWHSMTSQRQLNSFLSLFDLPRMRKKDIESYENK